MKGESVVEESNLKPPAAPVREQAPPEGASDESDMLLLDLIDESGDSFYEMDNNGNLVDFSNSLCKVLGYPREELQNQSLERLMDEKHARKFREAFTNVWVSHQSFSNLIWETTDKAGNKRVIEVSAYLVKNHRGKKLGFRGIARDATEKFKTMSALKEAQERYELEFAAKRRARRKMKNLFDFVPYPMIVFTPTGKITYINPAFTKVFGWTLEELIGRRAPYIPPGLEDEARQILKTFRKDPDAVVETKRLTKDGRVRDVSIRGQLSSPGAADTSEELFILRDITEERRNERINETLFKISSALPGYPVLEDLLDFITGEVKRLLNTEGAVVGLFDENRKNIYFLGVSHEDPSIEHHMKEVCHPVDKGVLGRVVQRGEAAVLADTSRDPDFYRGFDEVTGFATKSIVIVPLEAGGKLIGVLIALNKKGEPFDRKDLRLLTMIAGTVALSIENARFSKELNEAYQEVASLNRAKEKIINHLSHELKTPVSILMASLNLLKKRLEALPDRRWSATLARAERNIRRILDIQLQVEDIMMGRGYTTYQLMSTMLEQCVEELEALLAEKVGEGEVVQWLRERLEEEFGLRESRVEKIPLSVFVKERLDALEKSHSHRRVSIVRHLDAEATVEMPGDVMGKIVDGLVKNAVENTPDMGRVEVFVRDKGSGVLLEVKDCGVGIAKEDSRRIFEGYFATQDTLDYSSKRPFDFNAGGKGSDLLRMKVFSERYGFQLTMTSTRCPLLEKEGAACPGEISLCAGCDGEEGCTGSGGSTFSVFFPSGEPVKASCRASASTGDEGPCS
jgi:PAS domain S-box-containing protein